MKNGTQLTVKQNRRIRDVVTAFEATSRNTLGGIGAGVPRWQIHDAKITANNGTVTVGYSYTVRLGHWDMATPASGGAWVEELTTDFTAFYAGSLTANTYGQVSFRGNDTSGHTYFDIVGVTSLGPVPGTITASSTISLTAWNYSAQTYTGVVLDIVRNGMEPCVGSPGRLGVTVGTNGTVNGTTCTVQPIGVGAEVLLWPDPTTPGGYMFSMANSAE